MQPGDRLDFEWEMGTVTGRGNAQGDAIPIDEVDGTHCRPDTGYTVAPLQLIRADVASTPTSC